MSTSSDDYNHTQLRWKHAGIYSRYLFTVLLPHKLAIFGAGIYLNWYYKYHLGLNSSYFNVSMKRILVHDMSKFKLDEFIPYSHFFCNPERHNDESKKKTIEANFHNAVQRHYSRNDHHTEYFASNGYKMTFASMIELICDWHASQISYNKQLPVFGNWGWVQTFYHWNNFNRNSNQEEINGQSGSGKSANKMKNQKYRQLDLSTKLLLQSTMAIIGYDKDVEGFPNVDDNKMIEQVLQHDCTQFESDRYYELLHVYYRVKRKRQSGTNVLNTLWKNL